MKFDFPVVEGITFILPIVDEFVVNVGKSEEVIHSINDKRIKVVESVWDEPLREGWAKFRYSTRYCVVRPIARVIGPF